MEERKIDELGRIIIVPGNVYLIKGVNYTEYKNIYEWECLSSSESAYKFIDKITERVFWVENTNFHNSSFGRSGYHVFECIYDKREEYKKKIKQIIHK